MGAKAADEIVCWLLHEAVRGSWCEAAEEAIQPGGMTFIFRNNLDLDSYCYFLLIF